MTGMINRTFFLVELADGSSHNVTVGNPSLVAYERTASKRQWPVKPSDSPMLWQTFLSWHQLKAQGDYVGTFEKFSDEDCMFIVATQSDFRNPLEDEELTEDELEAGPEIEPVDPTQPEADYTPVSG